MHNEAQRCVKGCILPAQSAYSLRLFLQNLTLLPENMAERMTLPRENRSYSRSGIIPLKHLIQGLAERSPATTHNHRYDSLVRSFQRGEFPIKAQSD